MYHHARNHSVESNDSAFSCSNVISRSVHISLDLPHTFTIARRNIQCIPHYDNRLLIGETAAYYPKNCTTPLTVVIRKISGQGHFRDVVLECQVPSDRRPLQSLERGALVFEPNLDNEQPINYGPTPFYFIFLAIWTYIVSCAHEVNLRLHRRRREWNEWVTVDPREHIV